MKILYMILNIAEVIFMVLAFMDQDWAWIVTAICFVASAILYFIQNKKII